MNVEIWSDVACPWCYIGKRRFEAALQRFAHREQVKVTWRSFQLDPQAPLISIETMTELLARKYGMTTDQAAASHARIGALAAEEGLTYRLSGVRYTNTFDAHRLLHLAADRGVQDAMKERLMHAYFTENLPVGDVDTLVDLAADVGLDPIEARAVLQSDRYAVDVQADMELAAALGIRGVPFFVVDETYGVSGAQPAETFLEILNRAWADTHPLPAVAGADSEGH
ncbi:MAG TPA: DsbA family oxidoreductase [Chloroflexota bacterium]